MTAMRKKNDENSKVLPEFVICLSCPHLCFSKSEILICFLAVFPPAVPNDPLVPTAVLGETSSVGYVTCITSSDHLPSSIRPCACNPSTYYPVCFVSITEVYS